MTEAGGGKHLKYKHFQNPLNGDKAGHLYGKKAESCYEKRHATPMQYNRNVSTISAQLAD